MLELVGISFKMGWSFIVVNVVLTKHIWNVLCHHTVPWPLFSTHSLHSIFIYIFLQPHHFVRIGGRMEVALSCAIVCMWTTGCPSSAENPRLALPGMACVTLPLSKSTVSQEGLTLFHLGCIFLRHLCVWKHAPHRALFMWLCLSPLAVNRIREVNDFRPLSGWKAGF